MTFFISSSISRQEFVVKSKSFLNAASANVSDFHRIYDLYYQHSSSVDDEVICGRLGITLKTLANIKLCTLSIKQYKRIVKIMVELLR